MPLFDFRGKQMDGTHPAQKTMDLPGGVSRQPSVDFNTISDHDSMGGQFRLDVVPDPFQAPPSRDNPGRASVQLVSGGKFGSNSNRMGDA